MKASPTERPDIRIPPPGNPARRNRHPIPPPLDLKRTRRSWVGPALFMSQVGNSASFPFVIIEKANSAGQSGLGDCGRGVTRGNIRLSW